MREVVGDWSDTVERLEANAAKWEQESLMPSQTARRIRIAQRRAVRSRELADKLRRESAAHSKDKRD
jgi:hypothetical protein